MRSKEDLLREYEDKLRRALEDRRDVLRRELDRVLDKIAAMSEELKKEFVRRVSS